MVKANVDRILDILKEKKSVSINELAGKLSLPKTDVEKSAEYLEEDGVVKIDHKFPNTYVTLIEKPKKDADKKEEKTEQPELVQDEPQQPKLSQPEVSQPTPSPPPMPMPEQPGPSVDVAAPGMPPPPPPPQQQIVGAQAQQPNLPEEKLALPETPKVEDKPEKKPSKTPFLIDESLDIKPDMAENVTASLNVMQESPVQDTVEPQPDFNANPLEPEQPKFDMAPPNPQATTSNIAPDSMMQPQLPGSNIQQPQQQEQPSPFASQGDFAPKKEFTFPDYADTDVEKLEYLMEQAHDKLTNKDFQDINILYRAIYDKFTKSQDLSPNERHLLSEKIQDLFQRIKRLYLIEGITV